MTRISFLTLLALTLSACGGSQPPVPAKPSPAAPIESSPAPAAPDTATAATFPAWNDPHEIHELMEDNGSAMKLLRKFAKSRDGLSARLPAEELLTGMRELQERAGSYEGETPEKFRAFSDSAVRTAQALQDFLKSASDASPLDFDTPLADLRAACKNCHDVYKKD